MTTLIPATIETSVYMTGSVVLVLALAVRADLLEHRVPNALNLAGLILGLGLACLADGSSGIAYSAGGALVGCAALLPLYMAGGTGAGDVKLMGATGTFLGPSGAMLAAALTLITGAVLAIVIVLWRLVEPRSPLETSPPARASVAWRAAARAAATISIARKERFPYAVAIAVGVVATLWLRGALGALMSALGVG